MKFNVGIHFAAVFGFGIVVDRNMDEVHIVLPFVVISIEKD